MILKKRITKTLLCLLLVISMLIVPVSAMGTDVSVQPRYNNVSVAVLSLNFDLDNTVYCGLSVVPYAQCSGVSGIMKLFDSTGTCLAVWSVSDYEHPIMAENTYQGVYGETYTCTFFGYAYSNNQTPPDELELSVTSTCVDAD